MDFARTPDQELLYETARRFLAERWPTGKLRRLLDDGSGAMSHEMRAQVVDLGWTSLLSSSSEPGSGIEPDGVGNLAVVAECVGRSLTPLPVLANDLVAFALLMWGAGERHRDCLTSVVEGREWATWAVGENDRWSTEACSVVAVPSPSGYRLTGSKAPVECDATTGHLLVTATAPEGLTMFLVPRGSDGLTVVSLDSLDLTRTYSQIDLSDVELPAEAVLGEVGTAGDIVEQLSGLAVALQCIETVGATEAVFDMTLDYVKERKSFGRPIGSYQALKHRLADMLLWLETSKAVSGAALRGVESGSWIPSALAKAYVADRCPAVVRECLQLHGGIGFTWEHDIHLYLRRVDSNVAIYGDADHHRARLAGLASPFERRNLA